MGETPFACAETAFSGRYASERMRAAIDLYEVLLSTLEPSGTEIGQQAFILDRLAQLCYETTTFSPGNTKEDRVWFERGKLYGLQSLRLNPDFEALEEEDFVEAVASVTDASALLWTANNWGGLCGMNPIEGLLQSGNVRALYERCLAVDETYWGASAHNALGAMLIVTPSALGGDADAGVAHLEAALALAPTYLINRVVRAQYLGFAYDLFGQICGVRDAAFIERELEAVLDASVDEWPFWNREAMNEAEALLQTLTEWTP